MDLEEQAHEVQRQHGLRVAAQPLHAIDLDRAEAHLLRQLGPIGVGAALQAHLGRVLPALLAGRVPDLPRQLHAGKPHDPSPHVVVEGAHADGELVFVHAPDGLQALPLGEQPPHGLYHGREPGLLEGDAAVGGAESPVVSSLGLRCDVSRLRMAAHASFRATDAREWGTFQPGASELRVFLADVVAADLSAPFAARGLGRASIAEHDDPAFAVARAPRLRMARDGLGRAERPVRLYLIGYRSCRDVGPFGHVPERRTVFEHLLDLAAIVEIEVLSLLLWHISLLPEPRRGKDKDRRLSEGRKRRPLRPKGHRARRPFALAAKITWTGVQITNSIKGCSLVCYTAFFVRCYKTTSAHCNICFLPLLLQPISKTNRTM